MANDQLVGNIPMEKLISFFSSQKQLDKNFDTLAFESAFNFSSKIFS
jgi:hydroxymethylglutaryl-CoA lyase